MSSTEPEPQSLHRLQGVLSGMLICTCEGQISRKLHRDSPQHTHHSPAVHRGYLKSGLPPILAWFNSSLVEFSSGLPCSRTTPDFILFPLRSSYVMLMSPLSQAPPWVQSCGTGLGPASMLMADAPGRDVQRRWYFFSVLVTYIKWGVVDWVTAWKDRSCRACRCLLSSDSSGMLIPVTTNTVSS